MGMLAESRSRKSIGKDPNNTKWTRDTTTFGQRILRSQGWEPGQYLGAKDAPHSELHTAANASYIRVALKDDMKGLGFNKAKEDEVTGLDVFSDLLSRLNGKSQAEVEQDQSARLVIKTNRYVEQRWGPMRFVRGGLLVGDVLEEASDKKDTPPSATTATTKTTKGDDSKRESKKRKAESLEDSSSDSSDDEEEKKKEASKKRRKEEKKAKAEKKKEKKEKKGKLSEPVSTEASGMEDGGVKKSKEDKKRSKKAKNVKPEEVAEPDETSSSADDSKARKNKKSKRDKKDKKDKKESKEKKKKRKKAATSESHQDDESSDASPSSSSSSSKPAASGTSGQSTPAPSGSGTSTPLLTQRNFVRSRFIAQKQRVLMDTDALNQILMIKT